MKPCHKPMWFIWSTHLIVVAHVHTTVQHDVLASQRDNDAAATNVCDTGGQDEGTMQSVIAVITPEAFFV